MHRLFASVIAPLIEALEPRLIVETGAGTGRLTRRVLDAPGARAAVIHAVDPAPQLHPQVVAAAGERLNVHAERSVSAIGRIGAADLALLDGDPNWYAVHSELTMLAQAAERAERPAPLAIVHDVHWPFGRRDGYYDPGVIPPADRRAYAELGLVPGRRAPCPEGLRLAPYCAVRDFEPRSGVLSAVEDAVAASDLDWTVLEIPAFHGVAVLVEARMLAQRPQIAGVLDSLSSARFLGQQARRAESARLAAEVELAAARLAAGVERPESESRSEDREEKALDTVAAAPQPLELPQPDLIGELESERAALLAELAEQRARRGALEWQLERLGEDLSTQAGRLGAIEAERDGERRAAIESQLRLESSARSLSAEQEAAKALRGRVSELEKQADERARELREVVEREQLAQGRLAHREEALQAARAEGEALRTELDGLAVELRAARGQLDEIAAQLRRAGSSRRARFGRSLSRIVRTMTFRPPSPSALESACVTAERALPVSTAPSGHGDPRDTAGEEIEFNREHAG